MTKLCSKVFLAAAMVATPTFVQSGTMGDGAYSSSIESASEREITRRQEDLVLADQAIKAGDAARSRKEAQAAYDYYKQAVDMVPQGSAGGSLRSRAVAHFSRGALEYAEYLVSRGEYAEARRVAGEILEPRYNPDYRPAIVFLSRLEEADYFNKTVTPEFAAQRDEVSKLLNEAVGFYDSGRYDMAQKRYQQVLAIDKDNAAAYRGLEQVELGKQRYYDSAYNETRARMLWQVEKAWERPKRQFSDSRAAVEDTGAEERRGTELMLARLNRIIIPRVEFRDTPLRDAIGTLRRQSREQDGETINIVLDVPPPAMAAAPVTPVVEGEEPAAATAPSVSDRITLNLSNIPLYEALRYVALQAGLKVKVEPFAVSIVPLAKMTDTLEVREFRVPPGFITGTATPTEDTATFVGRSPEEATVGTRLSARQNAKDFLEAQGVEFPAGASARFIPGSSRLVVKNTASNLDLIQALVEAAMAEQPTQVEIEAKFVEVSQNNLKELGFDWTLGPLSIGGGVYGGGGNNVATDRAFPFNYPGTAIPVGENTVSGGLRTGSGTQPYSAISVNSLNALLAQSLGLGSSGGPAPGIFSVAGVFTNPQFQVMIRALNQKKGVDLMAAPKVTTKSGQKATITLNREFPYPQAFEPPQIPQNSGGGDANNQGGGAVATDPVVTPSFPTDFTTRNLGVTLEVEPQIGPDGYTIDLNLTPEVVDFEGFINYGSPIAVARQNFVGVDILSVSNVTGTFTRALDIFSDPEPQILTENVINQPIFSTRKVTTNVSIWDGQTVVIGGLIREDVQKVSDKVPILGDIPVAGVLFRSEVEQKIKRNLIIFTTARLMDAAGQLLRPEDDSDQEEVVEPLGLPPEVPLPARGNPKGLTRK